MKYFFDTNIISNLVRKDANTIKILNEIASEDDTELYINRLVYLESLRAIPLTHKKLYNNTKETLDSFIKLDITQNIYNESVEFARFCKSKGISLGKCEAIDYLHFITAKTYDMEIISHDGDMTTLEAKYSEFKSV
jgi:predicted nucleic acid-binding protein